MAIDFTRLARIHREACALQVSWAIHYAEGEGAWYFTIDSAAPVECWSGKERGFSFACDDVERWLAVLKSGWNAQNNCWNAL